MSDNEDDTGEVVVQVSSLSLDRLKDEEDALRSISPVEGALGRNASDYHNMYALFQQIVSKAASIYEDPSAFQSKYGWNDKTLNSWTKMISTARQILEGLNKMRNSDRLTSYILEKHTRDFSQTVALNLVAEIRTVIARLERTPGAEESSRQLTRIVNRRVPEIFGQAARETLVASKEEFGLLN